MKKTLPEDEAFALIEASTSLFHSVSDNFLKHAEEGYIKIRQESARFVVTMKLEMKKEAKLAKMAPSYETAEAIVNLLCKWNAKQISNDEALTILFGIMRKDRELNRMCNTRWMEMQKEAKPQK